MGWPLFVVLRGDGRVTMSGKSETLAEVIQEAAKLREELLDIAENGTDKQKDALADRIEQFLKDHNFPIE